jgi:hypothetical protein
MWHSSVRQAAPRSVLGSHGRAVGETGQTTWPPMWLRSYNLDTDGRQTLLDVGITHPLIDTYITNKSTVERGFAANA